MYHSHLSVSRPVSLFVGGVRWCAVAGMAAAMNVVEPCSTGLGGDAFALYYEAASQQVHCLMGNGKHRQAGSNTGRDRCWSSSSRRMRRSMSLCAAAVLLASVQVTYAPSHCTCLSRRLCV